MHRTLLRTATAGLLTGALLLAGCGSGVTDGERSVAPAAAPPAADSSAPSTAAHPLSGDLSEVDWVYGAE